MVDIPEWVAALSDAKLRRDFVAAAKQRGAVERLRAGSRPGRSGQLRVGRGGGFRFR